MESQPLKRCSMCHEEKPTSSFSADKSRADGLNNKCRQCKAAIRRKSKDRIREYNKQYLAANPEKRKLWRKKSAPARRKTAAYKLRKARYKRSPAGKATAARAIKKHVMLHPDRDKARRLAKLAIKTGKLKRLPCEVCGAEKSEAHHPDYSKPLEVRFLCRFHHLVAHGVKSES